MTHDIVLRHQSVNHRRQLLLSSEAAVSKKKQKLTFAEVAGGTTADCAAVCCCCPCGLVNLLVLAAYTVPAGLCKKALKKKKKKNKTKSFKSGMLQQRHHQCICGCEESGIQIHPISAELWPSDNDPEKDEQTEKKVLELEKEMWDRFYSAGFWRSPSQK